MCYQVPPISNITCRMRHTFAKVMEISHEPKKWFGRCSHERNHPISLWGREEQRVFFTSEDSMSLTLFFSQFNLCPCVAESGSLLNVWFDTAACFTPSTSFLFLSQSPDVLGPLKDSLMMHIFGTTLSMQKKFRKLRTTHVLLSISC